MRFRRRITCGLFVASILWLIAGCRSIPTTHYYMLEIPGLGDALGEASPGGLVIGVEEFRVDPPYDQDQLVYRVGEDSSEVGFYTYHRWASPLSRLLPLVVARAFTGIAGVASIEPAASDVEYDAILEGRLLYLEEVDEPDGQHARIRLELELSGDDGVLWSETVAAEKVGRAARVPEVVEQMTAALHHALGEARTGLVAAVRNH